MSDFESLMWTLDGDARLSSTVGNLTLLDRVPDRDRLRARIAAAAVAVPRLRQRVQPNPLGLGTPIWVDDDAFELDRHLRWEHLGPNAGQRRLLDRAMELMTAPFDRHRPLWEFVVFSGLTRGRAAMLQRIHHTLTDGEGGLRISMEFIDFERDAPWSAPISSPSGNPPWSAQDGLRRWVRDTAVAVADAGGSLVRPMATLRPGALVEMARSTARQANFTEHARSPLWTQRSLDRHLDLLSIPLADLRSVADRLGGTVNDVFVTVGAHASADLHHRAGIEVEHLRMAMPVSTRRSGNIGNHFSPSQSLVPTGLMSFADRFAEIHTVLSATKGETAIDATELLAGAANLIPPPLLRAAGTRLASTVDFVTSNLKASPVDVYLGGAHMTGNHPIGPLANTAWNMTAMSYIGQMCIGIVSDTAAVVDPDELTDALRRAFGAAKRSHP